MLRSPRPARHRVPLAAGRLRRALSLGPAVCCLALPCAALAQPAPTSAPASAQPALTPAQQPAPGPAAAPAPQPAPGGLGAPPPPPPGYPQAYPGYGAYPPYPGYYYPPPPPPAPPPKLRRSNPGLMMGGIALTIAGSAGLVVGGVLAGLGNGRYEIYCTDSGYSSGYPCSERDDEGLVTASWITLGASVVALGVGIPLWVIGGKRVPVTDADQEPQGEAQKAALRPTVSIGAGTASLRMRF